MDGVYEYEYIGTLQDGN